MTEPAVGQMNKELGLKVQQLAVPVCESSTHEEVLDKGLDSGDDGQREENSQGSEDRDEDDERLWEMEIDLDDVRTEDEEDEERDLEEDEEEMKHRLYKLVAQSRLTYLSSTDDELNKAGRSEGECDNGGEQEEETTEGLTYKLCQLEKEVRATQFSSTEDELDRVGIEESRTEEEGEDGKKEELAVKVCRLAKQINATQFSSTEDELDRAGRGKDGEEAIDDESLWKLQTKKTVQATQLRDLASLVSASQFSSTEDELDRFGMNEGDGEQEVNERGTESSVEMEDVWKGAAKRRKSFEDLDVKMFDLRDEETKPESGDERETAEKVLDDQIKIDDVQHSKTGQEERDFSEETVTGKTEEETLEIEKQLCEDKAEKAKETQEGQEMKLESVVESKKTEDIIHPNETREEHENQPEANWPDKNQGQDKFTTSKGGQRSWEAAADSEEEEEDTEFARIISSMLMMTLEDMQVETFKNKAAENRRINRDSDEVKTGESVKKERESGLKDDEAQKTNPSVENQNDNVTSAGRQTAEEITSEHIGENCSRKNESGEEEKDIDPHEKENSAVQQMSKTIEVDDEEQEDGEGTNVTEWKMMETQGDAGEVERCSWKEKEETKEKSAHESEQSSTSSPQEGLLSPEEIQNVSTGAHPLPDTLLE